jgi:uncharacterized repeat protein (TIGR02543 family)
MKEKTITTAFLFFIAMALSVFNAGAQMFQVDASQIDKGDAQEHYSQYAGDPFDDPETVQRFLDSFIRSDDRIVGGNPVLIDDYPWQVSMQLQPQFGGAHFCGGTIFDDKWIITASHCLVWDDDGDDLYLQPHQIRIRAGFSHLGNPSQGAYYNVSQIILHPSYSTSGNRFDIALVRISGTFDLESSGQAAVDIVRQDDVASGMTNPGVDGWVSGWGNLSFEGTSPNQLHAVEVPIVGGSASYPPSWITSDMLLAGASGQDACQGDSGGPFVVPDGNGWYKLAGVVSWGNGCGLSGYPGVYARVSYFENWLMENLDPTPPNEPQLVTFEVNNQGGQPVEDAMITVYPGGNETRNSVPLKMTRSAEPALADDSSTTNEGHASASLQLAGNTTAGQLPPYADDAKTGEWIRYWQAGINDNALGLGGDVVTNWYAAIRWMPEDLEIYEGYAVTKIRVYMNDEPATAAVMIWQGDIDSPNVVVNQSMAGVQEDWVEVVLDDSYMIDTTQELWIGWEVGDPGDGVFPAAFEDSPQHDELANLLQFGTNPWDFASAYGFDVVWNIEAYVEPLNMEPVVLYTDAAGQAAFTALPIFHSYTVEKAGYFAAEGEFTVSNEPLDIPVTMLTESDDPFVTFNVDMTDVEGFEWDQHTVYATGTFTEWAEPGSDNSIEMSLVWDAKTPPYTLYENFDGFDDFTTDLSPWTTLQLTSGNTWGSADFEFPGEGTEFAFMAFNPTQTVPPIDDTNPAVEGTNYAIAVQYTDLNDDKWLISPEVSINETSELSFWARSYTAAYGLERIKVMVSTTDTEPGSFTKISEGNYIEVPVDWTQYTFDLSDYAGETIHFAINYVSLDAFIFMLDAIELTADVEPSELIYTANVQMTPGEQQYKYFSNAFGEGWDGGEWPGDPNRVINVTGSHTINDVWGLITEPVNPIDLNTMANMTGDNLPPEIGSGGNARAAALYADRFVVVPSREGGNNIWVWDLHNPLLEPFALDYDEEIIEPVTFPINYVRTAGDAIYVSNLSLNPSGDGWGQGVFRIYRWDGLESSPEIVISYDAEPGRLGDAFSIIGDPQTDGHIIAHINTTKDFRVWNFENGVLLNEDNPDMITLDIEPDHINNHGIYNSIPGHDDLFLVTSNNIGMMIANLDGEVLAEWSTDIIDMRTYDPNIFYYNGNRYLTYTINNEGNPDIGARYQIVDISDGEDVLEAFANITTSNELAAKIVHDVDLGLGHENLTATNQVAVKENDEIIILAHVVGKGFVAETTDNLIDSYVLELVANPENGGSVSGAGEYAVGTMVDVSAVPETGYDFVNWTHDGTEVSSEAEFVFTMPDEDVTLTANFISDVEEVATLAELRQKPADGSVYLYTGDAVIVAMDGFRNRKFLQDETAAIMIDDNPGNMTIEYVLYDVITDVMGVVNVFNNMVQFQPVQNAPEAIDNSPVDPIVFAMDEITPDDQAKLIQFLGVSFVGIDEGDEFANGTNYTITDGENEFVLRTDFWNVDYIGEEIPHGTLNIAGVFLQYQEAFQLIPRFSDDMEIVEEEFYTVTFTIEDTNGTAITNATIFLGDMTNDEGDYVFTEVEPGTYNYLVVADMYFDAVGEVVVTDADVNMTVVMEVDDTSVPNTELPDVKLFPNPADRQVTILSDSNIREVQITDISGRIIRKLTADAPEVTVNTSDLNNGLYFVNIYTDNGVSVNKLQILK